MEMYALMYEWRYYTVYKILIAILIQYPIPEEVVSIYTGYVYSVSNAFLEVYQNLFFQYEYDTGI